jgi:hypothetical protein
MRRIAGGIVAVLSLVLASSALAHPPSSMTITSVIEFPSFPSTAPWTQTYTGSYSTSTGDTGTLTADAAFGAVPTGGVNPQGKPTQSTDNSVLHLLMTMTSNDGTSTLVLRCTQHATAADYSTYPIVPSTGSCAVLSATGGYAGLKGSGPITSGVADFNPPPSPTNPSGIPTLTDTVALG